MSNSIQSVNNLLPSQVTVSASYFPNLSSNGTGVGRPSYFDLEMTDPSGTLNGNFDSFCIDTDLPLDFAAFDLDHDGVYGESNIEAPTLSAELGLPADTTYSEGTPTPFSASVYSSYDPAATSGLGGLIEKPENLDLVNWIINNTEGSLAGFTVGEIQLAIWQLMDNDPPNADSIAGLNAFFNGFDQANVDQIKALAEANGEGFVPGAGEKIAVILVPDGNAAGGSGDTDADGNPDGNPDGQIIIAAVELAKLGDTVFEDSDADGIQDADEQGIAGATVNLLADVDGDGTIEANEVVDTTTTDADGNYHFTVLPSDYKVQFDTPDGFDMASPANQGNDDAIDSDGPISDVTSLQAGEVDPTLDAGFFKKAGLGDFVFEDLDGDGVQDTNEPGVEGVVVKLQNPNGSAVVDGNGNPITTTTDANGTYEFTGLTPGEYKVMFVAPDGTEFTTANAGNDDAADSDANPNNGMTQTVVLESGDFNSTLDAGIVKQLAGLGDKVFFDTDRDGIQDAGEAGVESVTVTLTGGGADGVVGTGDDTTATTTTDANGEYRFDGLNPGEEYKVTFSDLPTGFEFTQADAGNNDVVDSDANPANGMTPIVTLAPGEFNPTLDAGIVQEQSGLGDFVFEDTNADGTQDAGEQGIEGVEVKLLADTDGDGALDDFVDTTTTDATGFYQFTNLTPGDYKVMFTQPAGFDSVSPFQAGGDAADDSDADPNNGLMSDVVTLDPGEFDPTLDAGFYNTAGLGDFVFEDLDGDGVQDANEPGVEGVVVKLQNPDGSAVVDGNGNPITTTTDANGAYEFTGLTPGEYKVMFVAPDGTEFTTANAGNDDAADSDANPNNGMTQTVVLESGDFNSTLDAGIVKLQPGIDIEKFVNGFDADTAADAVEIAAGNEVTFTYAVKNTGEVAFAANDVVVTDDNGTAGNTGDDFNPTFVGGDLNSNNLLDVGETWLYSQSETAQDLTTVTSSQDVRFYLRGSSSLDGHDGNVRTFTKSGVSVEVSAFSSNKHGSDFRTAYLGAYGGGLGVTNRHESAYGHRADNGGSIDYILFEFDQDITVDKAFLDYVGHDSDISIWIGDRDGADITNLSGNLLNSFTKENNFGGRHDRWANFNGNNLAGDTVIISAFTGGSNDSFKLRKLDVSVAGETTIGNYQNIATVVAEGVQDSDAANYTNPSAPAPAPKQVLIEAEDMHLCNYSVEHVGNDIASGGEVIKLNHYDGYASTHFTGHSGYYQVDVAYYDENDGQSMGKVKIGGETVDTWNFDQHLNSHVASADNRVVRTVSESIYIEQGEEIKLSGWMDGWEFARFDSIEFTEVVAPQVFQYEAEDMHLSGYHVEHVGNHVASGGEVIRLSSNDGHASVNFTGPTGNYDILVGYFDENDGKSMAKVKVGGHQVGSWTFDELLGSHVAASNNFREFKIEDVHVEAGEQIKLSGWRDHYEFARFDYVKLVSAGSIGTDNGSNTPTLESTDLFTYVNGHAPGLIASGVVNDSLI